MTGYRQMVKDGYIYIYIYIYIHRRIGTYEYGLPDIDGCRQMEMTDECITS
jgi:hypothetical protein